LLCEQPKQTQQLGKQSLHGEGFIGLLDLRLDVVERQIAVDIVYCLANRSGVACRFALCTHFENQRTDRAYFL